MGPALLKIFRPSAAQAVVQPEKCPPKSFVKMTLPLTRTRSRYCAPNSASLSKQGICRQGEGYIRLECFPFRESRVLRNSAIRSHFTKIFDSQGFSANLLEAPSWIAAPERYSV